VTALETWAGVTMPPACPLDNLTSGGLRPGFLVHAARVSGDREVINDGFIRSNA
jgi:hypothetical protein